jgi:hydrogenase maturation protease
MTVAQILIAGVGNIFLGDDAFGVEVAQRLSRLALPDGVRAIDFGIRGLDLAYALLHPYTAVILVDATSRGHAPGTLYLVEPTSDRALAPPESASRVDPHSLDPVKVLGMAAAMGGPSQHLLLVGCEIAPPVDSDDIQDGLSEPVRAAVDEAVPFILSLVARILRGDRIGAGMHMIVGGKETGTCRT